MKISVVIPVFNECELVARAIERAWIAKCDEVVVVDGGSVDSTPQIARKGNCKFVSCGVGRGPQLNAGAQKATGDVILFLHVDTWLAENACQQIRESTNFENRPWGCFRQRIENPRWKFRLLEQGNVLRVLAQQLVYGDQGLFVTRHAFEQVNGFPDFPLMEDFEISTQLSKISHPQLLDGPIFVGARRWERNGVLRQTVRNWTLAMQYRLGVPVDDLNKKYHRHDRQ